MLTLSSLFCSNKWHKSTAGLNKILCNLCLWHSACVGKKIRELAADSSRNLYVPLRELFLCWSDQKTWQKQLKKRAVCCCCCFGSSSQKVQFVAVQAHETEQNITALGVSGRWQLFMLQRTSKQGSRQEVTKDTIPWRSPSQWHTSSS